MRARPPRRRFLTKVNSLQIDMTTDGPAQFIRANGVEFAYLSAGSGPLVLCLHGFPDTAASFKPLLARLAQAGFRAVAPYMRGYAPSEIPADGDYSALTLGRDVIALIEHFGAAQASLVGHDWGGVAAYAAAGLRPDRIRRMVIAGVPHPRRYLLRPSRAQLLASSYLIGFQLPWWPERRLRARDFAWLHWLIHRWSPHWQYDEALLAPVRDAFSDPQRLRAALAYFRAAPRWLLSPEALDCLYRPARVPVRQIYGEDDRCILPQTFQGGEHLFAAGFDTVPLPGIGHFMHLETPELFADRSVEFLRAG